MRSMKPLPRALFISHGGGPMPLLADPGHIEMVACLQDIAAAMPRPDAIVVVSAHWEASVPTLTTSSSPPLIYDYHGFPPESYEIEYPCPGQPALARDIHEQLQAAGLGAEMDASRGIDHGVFVPLKIMYPRADVPCVQLSLITSLDPVSHMAMGRALQGLSERNVLVIGSGFSFHNLRAFFGPQTAAASQLNASFEAWLTDVCANPDYPEDHRRRMLARWSEAPGARYCHPREEHLVPLHVCYGLAESRCTEVHHLSVMNKRCSMYAW